MEAVKQRNNEALPENLYFYRNKYGVEINLIFEKNRQIIPYEIKSSPQYNKDQFRNLDRFVKEQTIHLSSTEKGGLIYAGKIKAILNGYTVYPLKDLQGLFV
jgi:hypothetical protein